MGRYHPVLIPLVLAAPLAVHLRSVDAAQLKDGVLKPLTPLGSSPVGTAPMPSAESSNASTASSTLPSALLVQGNQQAKVPDWSSITFASLVFSGSGTLSGTQVMRQWTAGQSLDQVMTLGDFQDSLNLEGLNLYAVNKATGQSLNGAPATNVHPTVSPLMLSDFKLMERQTIGSLVKALPDLAKRSVSQIAPVADLLRPVEGDVALANTMLGDLLQSDPNLGTLRFDSLDLSKYKVSSLPGLDHVPFQAFKDWQKARIDDIPGLKDMPWSQFPTIPNREGVVGQLQIPSASAGEPAPDHVNLGGSSLLEGQQWLSGDHAEAGGSGPLADINNGLEPMGRTIYGKAFNVVLSQISATGVSNNLYFHACESEAGQSQISCTPYVIGPVSFLHYANGEEIFLGDAVTPAPPVTVPPQPTEVQPVATPSSPLVVTLTPPSQVTPKGITLLIGLMVLLGGVGVFGVRSLLKPIDKKGEKQHGHS